jgi:glycosyltransferase involved in cell wall biosynthesis
MSKIIAFPQRRSYARQARVEARAKNGSQRLSPGRMPGKQSAARTGSVTPIWSAPGRGIVASIVVATCKRPQLLNRCLAALTHQLFDPTRYEIIVVDDAPDVRTRAVVERWASESAVTGPRVYYLPSSGPHGPAAARNRGWHAARGALVAFTDDDTIPYRDWLVRGICSFDGIAQAVWGRVVTPLAGVPTEHERSAKNQGQAEFVTANCFCLKRVLEEFGGFDERFQCGWRDDVDLYFRMLQADLAVVHAPDAVVERPVEPASWGSSMQQQKKIQFDALLYKKHPALYREKISSSARWDYYATVTFLLGVIAAAMEANPMMLLGALAGWLLLTAHFFMQRLRGTSMSVSHIAEIALTSLLIPPLAVFWRLAGAVRFRVGFV